MVLTNNLRNLGTQMKYLVFIFFLVYCKFIYMHYSIVPDKNELTTFAHLENAFSAFIDTTLLLFLPFLLIKKRKFIYLFFFIIIDLFILTNIWYSRNFNAYLPLSLYFEFNNLSGLTNNILTSIRLQDIFIPITSTIALFIIYWKYPFANLKTRLKRVICFIGCATLLSLILLSYYKLRSVSLKERIIFPYSYLPMEQTFKFGIFYYFAMETHSNNFLSYSTNELKELEPQFWSPEIIKTNKFKPNIIIIIVESFLSFADELSFNGKEVTPNLNQLKKENTYYNSNVIPQVELGESSDGQFIYMTGLLPLKNTITAINYLDNTYIALPSLLKQQKKIIESRMVIPTGVTFWRQDRVCQNYSVDSLFSKKDYPNQNGWLNDEHIFKLAQNKDLNSKQPFLSIILTSSMHSPYNKIFENEKFDFPSDYSTELRNYLKVLHYTDKQIGSYIRSLKDNHLYENSIIIITSDHEAHSYNLNLTLDQEHISSKIPLYIINSPVQITKSDNYPMAQFDLFPTLLDIMGIQSSWRGVGRSLLLPDSLANSPRELLRREKAQEISEIIIYSDYFKSHDYNLPESRNNTLK